MIEQFLQQAIEQEIKRVTEEEIEAAKKRIDERKAQVIAGVILYVQKQMIVERLEQQIVITVKTQDH